jgi:hypothetical protein
LRGEMHMSKDRGARIEPKADYFRAAVSPAE